MTEQELQDLREVIENATKGPWRVSMSGYSVKAEDRILFKAPSYYGTDSAALEQRLSDAQFVVDMREYADKLLAHVDYVESILRDAQVDARALCVEARRTGRRAGAEGLWLYHNAATDPPLPDVFYNRLEKHYMSSIPEEPETIKGLREEVQAKDKEIYRLKAELQTKRTILGY